MVEEMGFGAAIVALDDQNPLSEHDFDRFSFEQLEKVCEETSPEHRLRPFVLIQMARKAITYSQWMAVYRHAPEGSNLEKITFGKTQRGS